MSMLRVAVADDSVLLREGLVRVLGEAGSDVVPLTRMPCEPSAICISIRRA